MHSHLDKSSLCGWAMSRYLPYSGFKWLKNFDNLEVNSVKENSCTGFILKVDLDYPEKLHELHNDHPLAPEKFVIYMLSDYCYLLINIR